jgi:hypothetical protein
MHARSGKHEDFLGLQDSLLFFVAWPTMLYCEYIDIYMKVQRLHMIIITASTFFYTDQEQCEVLKKRFLSGLPAKWQSVSM